MPTVPSNTHHGTRCAVRTGTLPRTRASRRSILASPASALRFQFPLLPAIAGIVLHTAVVWVAAYTIAPRILLMEQNQLPEGIGEPGSNISDSSLSHSLLRCDSPRMSRLVSCRPVWVQCLLAAFLVAFPAAMATASQRWLWSRYRKAVASKQAGEGPAGLPAFEQQEQEQQRGGQERQRREVSGRVAAGGLPTGVDPTALGDPLYEGLSRSQAVAVKVRRVGLRTDERLQGCTSFRPGPQACPLPWLWLLVARGACT